MIERSYGIIPLRRGGRGWEALLVQHGKGHWAFPKGHANVGEEAKMTAQRELKEETDLSVVQFLDLPHLEENYIFRRNHEIVHKTVRYFAAIVKGGVKIQREEINDYKWLPLEQAHSLATFAATQNVCHQIQAMLAKV